MPKIKHIQKIASWAERKYAVENLERLAALGYTELTLTKTDEGYSVFGVEPSMVIKKRKYE